MRMVDAISCRPAFRVAAGLVLFCLVAAIFAAGTGAADQADPKDKKDLEREALLGLARIAVKQDDIEKAREHFEAYLKLYGDDFAVRREYAGVLVQARRLEEAARQLEQLLKQKPDALDVRLSLADVYVLGQRYRQASAQLERAAAQAPDNLDTATQLARVHTFDGEFSRAAAIFDRSLARLRPGDEKTPRSLGGLLLDLGRPDQALAFLVRLRQQHANDLTVLADLIRCHARLGQRAEAIRLANDLAERAADAIVERVGLGDALYQAGDYEVAGAVYDRVLQARPKNAAALVGKARVLIQLVRPQEAGELLQSAPVGAAFPSALPMARAEYHQLVGEYTEAKQIYRESLRIDPASAEARLALAALYEFARDHEKAKAEYAKVPGDGIQGKKARIGIASTLYAQRRFEESIALCQAVLKQSPDYGPALALWMLNLAKINQPDEAEALGRHFIDQYSAIVPAVVPVRYALAKLLLDSGLAAAGQKEFESLIASPAGRFTASYYGLIRAALLQNDTAGAEQILRSVTQNTGQDQRNLLKLADQFYADLDHHRAHELVLAVLEQDPRNLAALIRLADIQLRLAQPSGHIDSVALTCQIILAESPSNVRGHLALARAEAVAQHYQASVQVYDQLIAIDPEFPVPQRERARVLFSDRRFKASEAAYQQMQQPAADHRLRDDLAVVARQEPAVQQLLEAAPAGPLAETVSGVAACLPDAEVRMALQHILLDYQARIREQLGAELEGLAKSKKEWRDYLAVPLYRRLIAEEPDNTEAIFDLGQVHGVLKQTSCAIHEFQEVLSIDPWHREAMVSLERAQLELQPRLRTGFHYFRQNGRDGLTSIERIRYGPLLFWPVGDENEWGLLGYQRARYNPLTGAAPVGVPLEGNIFTFGGQKRLSERVLVFGVGNLEDYPDRVSTRVPYEAGCRCDVSDCVHLWASTFLENVLENGESLRQDLYRLGVNVGGDFRPSRRWLLGGNYRYADYSDVNALNELYLFNEYSLTLPPKQLKLVATMDYQSFANPTIFPAGASELVLGTIHPYFAPAGFGYFEGRVEWYRWLSRDYFVYAQQCWYSLQYGFGFDTRSAVYHDLRLVLNFDVRPWLSIGGDGGALFSPVYRTQAGNAFLVLRFPFHLGL